MRKEVFEDGPRWILLPDPPTARVLPAQHLPGEGVFILREAAEPPKSWGCMLGDEADVGHDRLAPREDLPSWDRSLCQVCESQPDCMSAPPILLHVAFSLCLQCRTAVLLIFFF